MAIERRVVGVFAKKDKKRQWRWTRLGYKLDHGGFRWQLLVLLSHVVGCLHVCFGVSLYMLFAPLLFNT